MAFFFFVLRLPTIELAAILPPSTLPEMIAPGACATVFTICDPDWASVLANVGPMNGIPSKMNPPNAAE